MDLDAEPGQQEPLLIAAHLEPRDAAEIRTLSRAIFAWRRPASASLGLGTSHFSRSQSRRFAVARFSVGQAGLATRERSAPSIGSFFLIASRNCRSLGAFIASQVRDRRRTRRASLPSARRAPASSYLSATKQRAFRIEIMWWETFKASCLSRLLFSLSKFVHQAISWLNLLLSCYLILSYRFDILLLSY